MRSDDGNLDLLRSIAVSLVLICHVLIFHGLDLPTVRMLGLFGVLLFFVHTCLVLMFSLTRLPKANLWLSFVIRRIFRIYPLSVLTVLCVNAFHLPLTNVRAGQMLDPNLDMGGILQNLFLVQNLLGAPSTPGVLWSLPYEMQMYLVLPVCFWLARRWPVTIWALWGASLLAPLHEALKFLPNFLPGVIAFSLWGKWRRLPSWLWPVVLGLCIVIFVRWPSKEVGGTLCLLVGVFAALVIEISQPEVKKACHWVAQYSYGIYLFHLVAIYVGFLVLSAYPAAVQWTAFVTVLCVLPVVSFHFLEQPMIALGKKTASLLAPAVSTEETPVAPITRRS